MSVGNAIYPLYRVQLRTCGCVSRREVVLVLYIDAGAGRTQGPELAGNNPLTHVYSEHWVQLQATHCASHRAGGGWGSTPAWKGANMTMSAAALLLLPVCVMSSWWDMSTFCHLFRDLRNGCRRRQRDLGSAISDQRATPKKVPEWRRCASVLEILAPCAVRHAARKLAEHAPVEDFTNCIVSTNYTPATHACGAKLVYANTLVLQTDRHSVCLPLVAGVLLGLLLGCG